MKYFFEDCEQYEEIREKLRSRLLFGKVVVNFPVSCFSRLKFKMNSRKVDKS